MDEIDDIRPVSGKKKWKQAVVAVEEEDIDWKNSFDFELFDRRVHTPVSAVLLWYYSSHLLTSWRDILSLDNRTSTYYTQ